MTTTLFTENGPRTPKARSLSKRAHTKSLPLRSRIRAIIGSAILAGVLVILGIASMALVSGSWMVTPVLSGSMRPGFAVGGVVISERVPVGSLAVRDVIVFQRPDRPSEEVVHRIVKMTRNPSGQVAINTQGDANTVRDPWTLTIRGNTAYQVRWSLPLLGYVAVAFQNHRGIALLGAGLVLISIASVTLWKARRRDNSVNDVGNVAGNLDSEDGANRWVHTQSPQMSGPATLKIPSGPWSSSCPYPPQRPRPLPVPSLDSDLVE